MVRVPVIAPREFHDEIAARERTRHSNRAHHRLGARGNEAHLLEAGVRGSDALRQLDLARAWRTIRRAELARGDDGGNDLRMRVTEDERAPGIHEVEIRPAVSIVQMSTCSARDEERRATHRTERAHR